VEVAEPAGEGQINFVVTRTFYAFILAAYAPQKTREIFGIVSTGTIRDQIDTIRDNAKCHSTLYVVDLPFGTIEVINLTA